jgi:hypothetical protein
MCERGLGCAGVGGEEREVVGEGSEGGVEGLEEGGVVRWGKEVRG